MTKITLTEEQMEFVCQASSPVAVCSPQGLVLGNLNPELTPEFIAEMRQRAATKTAWYSSEQVRDHLRALEEAWEREGPFDEKRMREILEEACGNDAA